ncbi:MAG TPA: MFS transporter, partial [Caulobacteraceae bacterium]|nr:MFS transporter [Caulobacteraceae bacterium]
MIGICLVIAGLEGYAIQALGVAAPRMAPSLHMALRQVGYAASATMAAMGLGAIAGGWLADRFGRRRVMTISVVVFGLSTLLTAAAWSADALVLVRLATGLGLGGAMPNIIAVASEISTPERRARAVTTVSVGLPAGAATAALVTRVFSHGFDWRLIFVIGGILALLVSPAVALLLPEPARRDPAARFVDRRAIPALFFEGRWIATLLLWIAICLTMIVLSVMTNWLPTLMIAKGFSGDAGSLAALVFGVVGAGGGLA